MNGKPTTTTVNEIRNRANSIANEALQEDENLLAVALAAPSIKLAVVQFRDRVEINATTTTNYLSIYWRELGDAWNHSDGSQFWGTPFRDCGPLSGRWLWPFSATVQSAVYR